MFVKGEIVSLFVLAIFLALPARLSTQEKPEDCVKGKQFWSKKSVIDGGACISCPIHWTDCYNERIEDQERCVHSCHVKPKPVTSTTKSLSTTLTPIPTSESPKSPNGPNVYFSLVTPTKGPREPKADEQSQQTSFDIHRNFWILVVAVILTIFTIAVIILIAVLLTGRLNRTPQREEIPLRVIGGDPENPNDEAQAVLLHNAEQAQQLNDDHLHVEEDEHVITNGSQVSDEQENCDEELTPAIQETGIREETEYKGSTASFLDEVST